MKSGTGSKIHLRAAHRVLSVVFQVAFSLLSIVMGTDPDVGYITDWIA